MGYLDSLNQGFDVRRAIQSEVKPENCFPFVLERDVNERDWQMIEADLMPELETGDLGAKGFAVNFAQIYAPFKLGKFQFPQHFKAALRDGIPDYRLAGADFLATNLSEMAFTAAYAILYPDERAALQLDDVLKRCSLTTIRTHYSTGNYEAACKAAFYFRVLFPDEPFELPDEIYNDLVTFIEIAHDRVDVEAYFRNLAELKLLFSDRVSPDLIKSEFLTRQWIEAGMNEFREANKWAEFSGFVFNLCAVFADKVKISPRGVDFVNLKKPVFARERLALPRLKEFVDAL